MADCRRGRIDKILVKSSSRFARNAKESLEAVRELKALGIAVCFEEDKIDTSKLSGELLTAIFAMLAQKESEAKETFDKVQKMKGQIKRTADMQIEL